MANYSVLKAAVQAVVKTNGNQEITGANMQSTLISIINSLGTGYQFMGVATPSTSPGTPDYNVAYIGGAGTYANFGTSVTVPVGSIGVFKYNGSWTKEQIALFAGIDDVPTANSNNLVKSGGVYNDISDVQQALQDGLESVNEEIDEQLFDYYSTTTAVSNRQYFNGLARISNNKYEESTSTSVWIVYIPVVSGRTYRIQTKSSLPVKFQSTWMGIMFSTEAPANNGQATSIVNFPTGNRNFDETYTATANGYVGVGVNDTQANTDRIVFTETTPNAVSKIDELENDVDEIVNNVSTENPVAVVFDTNYVAGLIMRNTSSLFESTSATQYTIFYIPVLRGEKYRITGSNYSYGSTTWSAIGFSNSVPVADTPYTDVLHFDSTGAKYFEKDYTIPSDGYILIFNSTGLENLARLNLYKITNIYGVGSDAAGKLYETNDAKTELISPPPAFNIGMTNLRAKVSSPTPLQITSTGSNYNLCIDEYLNVQNVNRTSKLIKVAEHNIDPHIGDFSNLSATYLREVIGVDSEGWIYCAQKLYANNSNTDDANIYRTKDLVNFEVFFANTNGCQLIEMENGELCIATMETERIEDVPYIKCNIYITASHKTQFVKKFSCTQTSQYSPAVPWSWGMQTRGSIVAVGEYGGHGQCGVVWYSRDYGQNFYEVFDLREKAPDVPHAHVHGVCIDPYFDRLYIINGDNVPASSAELLYKNARIWWWDYNGETLSNNLKNTINWNYISVGEDTSLGAPMQFVNGYALKDCILLFSDSGNNGIFRINRKKKSDTPTIDFAFHLGVENAYTKFCGGNMFRMNDKSPLFICGIREFSNDLDPNDADNPSHSPNTYANVLSRVYSTYDGFHFEEVWIDNTYGTYTVHYADGTSEQRSLAKCGRDMSVYQLPNGKILLKYLGRAFQYVSYNNSGVTSQKGAYVDFANDVVEFVIK